MQTVPELKISLWLYDSLELHSGYGEALRNYEQNNNTNTINTITHLRNLRQ